MSNEKELKELRNLLEKNGICYTDDIFNRLTEIASKIEFDDLFNIFEELNMFEFIGDTLRKWGNGDHIADTYTYNLLFKTANINYEKLYHKSKELFDKYSHLEDPDVGEYHFMTYNDSLKYGRPIYILGEHEQVLGIEMLYHLYDHECLENVIRFNSNKSKREATICRIFKEDDKIVYWFFAEDELLDYFRSGKY